MKSFWGKLLVIFIFGFLPTMAIYLVAQNMLSQVREETLEKLSDEVRQRLLRVADISFPDNFYFRLITDLTKQLEKPDLSNTIKARLIDKAKTLIGRDFNVYLLDDEGAVVELPGYVAANRFVIGKLWDILAETSAYQPGDERRQLKRLQILLGAEASAGVIKNHEGQLLSLKKKRKSGFLYWKRLQPDQLAGVLVITFPVLSPGEILKRVGKRSHFGGFRFAYWDLHNQKSLYKFGKISNENLLRNRIEKGATEYLLQAGRVWLTLNTGHGAFLGSLPLPCQQNFSGMLNFLLAIAITVLCILLFNRKFDLKEIYLSTGSKLLALLLVALAIPVSGLLLTGITALTTYEKVLWTRLEKEKIARLSAVEDDFAEEERNFVSACRSLRQIILKKKEKADYAKVAQAMVEDGQAIRIDLVGLDGEPVCALNEGSWFEGLEKSLDAYSRYLIEQKLLHRSLAENIRLRRKSDPVLQDVFANADFGFAQITEAPDRVHNVRFGLNELLWYWNLVDIPGHRIAVISIFQARNIARHNFLTRVLDAEKKSREIFAVFDVARAQWLGDQPGAEALEVMRATVLSDRPEMRSINAHGRKWMALAYPGRSLAPYNLMLLTDEREVSDRVAALYRILSVGLLVIVALALLIARLLAETFLKPVRELDHGMLLVQQRNPEAKVIISSGDEFGELADAFNHMVDELNEMQLAKSVQEALFPQKKLALPGFATALFNLPASDLGGDYSDYIKLDEQHYLLLIGDVSGHGTPAALCMAMAKAAVFKACREGLNFTDLPGRISSLILQTLQRKKMMTMLFMLLNCENSTLQLINAGHNWPLLIKGDGKVEEVELVGMPLGVRRNSIQPEIRTICLNPGEILFSYTDALVEVQAPHGEIFGHEKLYREIACVAGKSPEEVVTLMKLAWDDFREGGLQQDDLTMLVIKNVAEETTDVI